MHLAFKQIYNGFQERHSQLFVRTRIFEKNYEYKMFACIGGIFNSLRTNKIGELSTERSYQSKMFVAAKCLWIFTSA